MPLHSPSYRSFLSEELLRRVRANPRYSQRAFARDLGLSPGELSEIIKGVRKLTHKSAGKIAKSLGLNPVERQRLYELIDTSNGGSPGSVSSLARVIELDRFEITADPTALALLCLTELTDFKWSETWIARRLDVTELEVRIAIERLMKAGFLRRSPTGKGPRFEVAVPDYAVSPEDIPSQAIRDYHRVILQKAAQALDLQPVKEREISGISFAVRKKDLPAIKKEISAFLDHLADRYGKADKNKDAVYHLETAFFRLDKGENV